MSASPLDPPVHMLTTLAPAIGGAALATLSTVMFLRWLGLHWTETLPGVLPGPLLWPFDHQAGGFVAATAPFATATGEHWHHDDMRHGAVHRQDVRAAQDAGVVDHHVGPAEPVDPIGHRPGLVCVRQVTDDGRGAAPDDGFEGGESSALRAWTITS